MLVIAQMLTPDQRAQLAIGAVVIPASGRAGLANAEILRRQRL
jgi:hypothetical protein